MIQNRKMPTNTLNIYTRQLSLIKIIQIIEKKKNPIKKKKKLKYKCSPDKQINHLFFVQISIFFIHFSIFNFTKIISEVYHHIWLRFLVESFLHREPSRYLQLLLECPYHSCAIEFGTRNKHANWNRVSTEHHYCTAYWPTFLHDVLVHCHRRTQFQVLVCHHILDNQVL